MKGDNLGKFKKKRYYKTKCLEESHTLRSRNNSRQCINILLCLFLQARETGKFVCKIPECLEP